MATLSHQSAINENRTYWISADPGHSTSSQFVNVAGGSVMEYNADIQFQIDAPGALSTARILGTAGSLFVQSPTSTYFTMPGSGLGQVVINNDATQNNGLPALYVSSSLVCDNTLVNNNKNPNSVAQLIPTYNAAGQQQAYYNLYNGNSGTGGIQFSTLQMWAYDMTGGIAQNYRLNPDGTVVFPNAVTATALVNVSTINGAPPFEGSNIINLTTVGYQNNNNAVRYFNQFAVIPNSYYEGSISGRLTWSNAPGANDFISVGFYGGSAQLTDQLNLSLLPAAAGSNLFLDFALSGQFQSSALASNIENTYQVNVSATPLNYTLSVTNGFLKYQGPQ